MARRGVAVVAALLAAVALCVVHGKTVTLSQGDRDVTCSFGGVRDEPWTPICKLAEFGTPHNVDATTLVVGAPDEFGCSLPVDSATGAAVIVKRGVCPFTDKATAAAKAGAVLLVVVNSDGTLPILGGRPDRDIDFPVVLVTADVGAEVLTAIAAAPGGVVASVAVEAAKVIDPVRTLQQRMLMQPRQCSGHERVVVVAVSSQPVDEGFTVALINSAGAHDVAINTLHLPAAAGVADFAAAAHRFIAANTITSDIVVVLLGARPDTVHALTGSGEAVASRFCALHGAAVFAATDVCADCSSALRAAFRTAPSSPPGATSIYPSPHAFVAYADAAVSLLDDLQSGGQAKLFASLREHLAVTRVDAFGHIFYDLQAQSLPSHLTVTSAPATDAGVDADGGTTAAVPSTSPSLFLQAPGRVSTMLAGTSPALLLNAADVRDRWLATLVRGEPLTAKAVASRAGDPDSLTTLSPSATRRVLGNATHPVAPKFIPVGQAGAGVWCQVCFAQYAHFGREERRMAAASTTGTAKPTVTPASTTTYPFVTSAALRDWCTWLVDGSDDTHTPAQMRDGIRAGDTVFVANNQLITFFVNYSGILHQPYVLVTDSAKFYADDPAAQAVPGVWHDVVSADHNILAWWAMDITGTKRLSKLHALPLGVTAAPGTAAARVATLQALRRSAPAVAAASRTHLACAGADADESLVTRLRAAGESVLALSATRRERWEQLQTCLFTLGSASGDDTHTVWDATAFGSVPVVLARNRYVKALYKGGPFLVVRRFSKVTAESLYTFVEPMRDGDAGATVGDVSALFAARWFEQLGAGVRHVLKEMHHPSTNTKKESAWETTWVARARKGAVEAAVTTIAGPPLPEACGALIDRALFDDRLPFAEDVMAKCHHFYPTSAYMLAAHGNLAFMQDDVDAAARFWDVAAQRLFLSGQHRSFRKALRRRVTEGQRQATQRSAGQPLASSARSALRAHRVPSRDRATPLVFIYISDELPAYLETSLLQARCSNEDAPIVFVGEAAAWEAYLAEDSDRASRLRDVVHFVPLHLLREASPKYRLFNAVSMFSIREDALWHTAIERLFVLQAMFNTDVLSFDRGAFLVECDNMLYGDLSAFAKTVPTLSSGMAVLPMSPSWCSLAVMWVARPAALGRLNNWFLDRLLLRDSALLALTGGDAHEMRLLGVFREQNGPASLQLLPTQPNSAVGMAAASSPAARPQRMLFDPAAWGQFAGGTPRDDQGPGFLDPAHTLGDAIRIRRVKLEWRDGKPYTRWCPFSVEGDDCVVHRLMNLHVHSKRLGPWATCAANAPADASDARTQLLEEAQHVFETQYDHDEEW